MIRILLAALFLISWASAAPLSGKVVKVSDGDTVTVLIAGNVQVKIRLAGIDAPESSQAFGEKSRRALAGMIAGKQVVVIGEGKDRYQRVIGWIRLGKLDVNREMVRQGWAWHYVRYNQDPDLARLQAYAVKARRGLWDDSQNPIAPWDFRASKKR